MRERMRIKWFDCVVMFLFGLIIGLYGFDCEAENGDWWVNLHLGSHHVGENQWRFNAHRFNSNYTKYLYTDVEYFDYNEINLGAGIGYEFHRNFEARAGFVDKNSFNHTTLYAGANWHTAYSRPVYVGLFGGVASGYRDTPTGGDSLLIGFVQPNIGVIAFNRVRVEIGVVPEFFSGETESTVWTLSAGFRF